MAETVERFGGIDVCVNNASAINLVGTEQIEMKRYDLMQDINTRGTFVLSKLAVPHLRESANPHVLTLSPPLSLEPRWAKDHVAYTIAKYGMSLCTLGMAAEFSDDGIAFNSLWPRTIVATAAVQNLLGGDEAMARARTPEIMSDACPRDPEPAEPRVHRQLLPRRGRARRGGRHRLHRLRGGAGGGAGPRSLRRRDRSAGPRLSRGGDGGGCPSTTAAGDGSATG